jgi:cell division transport system permease protein
MISWLAYHRSALLDALSRLLRTPFASLFTALAIGVALSLPAGLYLTLVNLDRLAGQVPAQSEISLFISDKASQTDREGLKQRIDAHPGLSRHRFVSREAALENLNAQGLADVTAGLGKNPLPDAWILTPKEAHPAKMEALRKQFAAWPGVESVQLDSAWAERLHAFLQIGERLVQLLAALFGLALIAIASNAIRAQVLVRRDEIEVSRLIGATDRYIRRPFLYFGVLQGASGGLMTLVAMFLMQASLDGPVSKLAVLYGSPYRLQGLSLMDGSFIVAWAILFSWLGAWVAVSRTLYQVD